jgi:hypothetical protein
MHEYESVHARIQNKHVYALKFESFRFLRKVVVKIVRCKLILKWYNFL